MRRESDFASRGHIYRSLGVRPIINAQGTSTTLGGSMMPPEVVEAMAAASGSMVFLEELNDRAGEAIARHTGAEAGLVVVGAACGMLLQAAAVIAGTDAEQISRLPDTTAMKNRIVILNHHRDVGYLQAWRTAGATLTPVETLGAADAEAAVGRVMDAVDDRTVAIGYVASRWLPPDPPGFLPTLTAASHSTGVPVIVDAAAMLPPAENLTRYTREGVDMVTFSGGKAIRGPQSAGILAGTEPLIRAAAMNASPNSAIGRVAKVCKEEIVGLVTALELYAERDHAADQRRWTRQAGVVANALKGIPGVTARVLQDDFSRPVPEAAIYFDESYGGPSLEEIADLLAAGDPPIVTGRRNMLRSQWEDTPARSDDLFVNPHNIVEGDEHIVAGHLHAILSG